MGWFRWLLRSTRAGIAWMLVAVLLITNVLTLTWSAASAFATAALATVGVTTVAAREASRTAAQRVAARSAARQALVRVRGIAGRAMASLPGQYIPFIGVGVIASATAWDIYDTCKLAEELTALDKELGEAEADICGLTLPDWVKRAAGAELPPPL